MSLAVTPDPKVLVTATAANNSTPTGTRGLSSRFIVLGDPERVFLLTTYQMLNYHCCVFIFFQNTPTDSP